MRGRVHAALAARQQCLGAGTAALVIAAAKVARKDRRPPGRCAGSVVPAAGYMAETLYRWLHGGYMEPRNNKAQPGRLG